VSCLAENAKMRTIARKHEAELRFEYGEGVTFRIWRSHRRNRA
jgi:hypothetical protein